MKSDIKDKKLAAQGELKIEWASQSMPVLNLMRSSLAWIAELAQRV